jgi:elongation factor G
VNLEPLIQLTIEPTFAGLGRLSATVQAIALKTGTEARVNEDTGIIKFDGWSEEQLFHALALLKVEIPGEYGVGAPQVTYRESLAKPVDVDFTHKKQSGGTGQFGRVKVKVTPGERGSGINFIDEIKGGNIPREYIPSVEKGMREQAESGYLVGFPIIDFDIHLYDGAYHDVDSSTIAFEIAGRGAMREVAEKAGIKLLEPIMKVEVVTPEDYLGDVIGDINSRRGQIQGTDTRGNAQVVEAMVPLATMLGYLHDLHLFTQGRAQYTLKFSHYDEVPDDGGPPHTEPAVAALRA